MKLENSHPNGLASLPRLTNAVEKLGRLQTELVSEALRRAVGAASAAMAHQLGEPLTALLLCLHELKQASDRPQGTESASARSILEMALREAHRVSDIIQRVGSTGETLVDVEAAVARGRVAIDIWAQDNQTRAEAAAALVHRRVHPHPLTPREHEVLALIIGGYSNKEGGHRLGISTRTFEAHRAHLMGKLGTRNAADLVRVTLANQGPVQLDAEESAPAATAAG